MSKRLLIPSAALLWGLQFAFLNPALALLLVSLFHATAAQVGIVLAVYNASGFVASLVLPGYADRSGNYLRVMLACGALTFSLAAVLAATISLPVAVLALVALGGPAGVGSSLLFAHLKHSGASPSDVVNTRAVVSFAWVAGPPLAAFLISRFGNRSILLSIAVVAVANIATTWIMIRQTRLTSSLPELRNEEGRVFTTAVAVTVSVFVVLQATNSATVSIMTVFVPATLGLNVTWAGLALGAAAALEIPALLLVGRLQGRVSNYWLLAAGCVVGIGYYAGMTVVSGPVLLLVLQALNAGFFAVVAGVGLALFQEIIPRPGLATGLYTNTRRLGAIVSGFIISLGSFPFGYRAVFATCAALTFAALTVVALLVRSATPNVAAVRAADATAQQGQ